MSFDVYVQWFLDGEADGVPEERIRALFGGALKTEDEFGWRLSYGRDAISSHVYLSRRKDGAVTGITVNRPVAAPELWQTLFELLAVQNGMFFFPGGGMYVRSGCASGHLPPDMCEALGEPNLVTSAEGLIDAINAA